MTVSECRRAGSGPLLTLWSVPAVLLLVSLLSYALQIRSLGFYWDDWPGFYVARSLGGEAMTAYTASDRPVNGWIGSFTAPLLNGGPLRAQCFALVLRWLVAVGIWWTVLGLWPEKRLQAAAVGLLGAVYPGFSQQPIAWIYSQTVYIPWLACVVSLGAMVWAVRRPRWFLPLTALALSACLLHLLNVEYFAGLELWRMLLLWVALTGGILAFNPANVRGWIRHGAPYLLLTGAYLFWRMFLFRSARPATDQAGLLRSFAGDPLRQIAQRVHKLFGDVLNDCVFAWTQTFSPSVLKSEVSMVWFFALVLLFATAAAIAVYLLRWRDDSEGGKPAAWHAQALWVGFSGVLLGGVPVWAANRQVVLGELYDRYSIPAAFGACLFAAAAVEALLRTRRQRIAVLSVLVGCAAAFQYRVCDRFARDWAMQKSFFWQLSWRVPGLVPGTPLLVVDESPLFYSNDYAKSAALNLTYAPGHRTPELDYWAFHLTTKLHRAEEKIDLKPGTPLRVRFRSLSFDASTAESLLVWYSPPGCLKVADPARDEYPAAPLFVRAARPFSHPGRILPDPPSPARPPADVFGAEPAHGWCYFYQKADLARQAGNWAAVVNLMEEAQRRRLRPGDPSEWVPFIEGYLRIGRLEEAQRLARQAQDGLLVPPPDLARLCEEIRARERRMSVRPSRSASGPPDRAGRRS